MLGVFHIMQSSIATLHTHTHTHTHTEGVKRSKSELVLRRTPREEVLDPLSADEREEFKRKKMSLSLSLDPLDSSSIIASETFHTATSSPPTFPQDTAPPTPSTTEVDDQPSLTPQFKLGPVPDDSDDMSSTEDYHKPRIVEGQSSSSVERSPEERHQRAKYRRRMAGDGRSNRRQVTEAEALRAMQRLCSRVAQQKMLVISSLENDCSKEDLNRQIQVLQELQKKYVRLEMALQYSFFDNGNRRNMMVTPIQETPSLTLSESDMQVTTETTDNSNSNGQIQDPLISRIKEQELEASDNVSTSNDELPSESHEVWDDPLRTRSSSDSDHLHNLDTRRLGDNFGSQLIDVPLPEPVSPGLTHPIDFDEVISVPGWVTRGAGARTHHEYEVRISLGPACRWQLLRRYRRFRDLYLSARAQYGPKVASIPFPSRQLWSSEGVARSRRPLLESFLRRLLTVCSTDKRCPFHAAPLTKDTLVSFSPFFRKGVFESGKCGTG
ncbi:hypothetical protein O0L34_g13035 [Tuta absoluta]|nr:hypothetical protein O0L34_g13035 [Tuta absoluta]